MQHLEHSTTYFKANEYSNRNNRWNKGWCEKIVSERITQLAKLIYGPWALIPRYLGFLGTLD